MKVAYKARYETYKKYYEELEGKYKNMRVTAIVFLVMLTMSIMNSVLFRILKT